MQQARLAATGKHAVRAPKHYWIAVSLLFLLILFIGAMPDAARSLAMLVPDKVLHFVGYGLLSKLLYSAFPTRAGIGARALAAWLTVGMLGAHDEAALSFMPYRNAELLDWLWNMSASLSCITLLASIIVYRGRNAI